MRKEIRGISRRDFIKGAAASAVGVATMSIFGGSVFAAEEETSEEAMAGEPEGAEGGGGEGGGGMGGSSGDIEAAKAQAAAEGRVFGYSGPGDWLGQAPGITDFAEEKDFDVIVIGGGHAGVQAALAAAEEGKSVAVLERLPEDSFAWYGEDIGAWNSQFAINQGFAEYDLGQVVDEFVTRGGGRSNPDIVRSYVYESGPTLDHMLEVAEEMGVDSRVYTYDNTPDGWVIIQANHDYDKIAAGESLYDTINKTNYPLTPGTKTWAASVQFMGVYNDEPIQGVAANSVLPDVQQACIDKACELGAEWFYGCDAQELVQDESGAVIGVVGLDEAGNYIKFNASTGVVVCGGDYAGNAEMCWALLNEVMEKGERSGTLKEDFYSFMGGRNGSSIKLMCWAGAMLDTAPRGHMAIGGGLGGPWGANAMLWLNSEGKRFCNEGNLTGAGYAMASQKAGKGYLVTDAKWMKSVCSSGLEHGGPNGGRPQYYQDMLDGMEAIEPGPDGGQVKSCTIAERGYSTVIKADSLEELAEYIGVEDVDTFLASIAEYNDMCYAGVDSKYGKHASAMIPVDEAPYYATVGNVGSVSGSSPSMVTLSGVITDADLAVLDADKNPIPGLYAGGNTISGRYGLGYTTPCAGNSIGMAVTHGRLAGKAVCS